MRTFEEGFEDVERSATGAARATTGLLTNLKQLRRAAQAGDISSIRRTSERLATAVDAVRQEVANARQAWPFDEHEEVAYLEDGYEGELVAAASAIGLRIAAQDGRLLAYPSVVRVLPGERSVRIDRKRVAAVRPSRLSAQLKAAQSQKPRFAVERFLESLFRAYRRIVGDDGMGRSVSLVEVHELLTLLPGMASEYSRSDLTRDIFTLDRSGVDRTKGGFRVSLPASTGTKSARGSLSFVAPDGELVTYYAVRFEPPR